jgi:hypothetical protein
MLQQDVGTIRKAGRTIESCEVRVAPSRTPPLVGIQSLRDQGVSAEEAAGYARNVASASLTWRVGASLNSLFLCHNAGMQGTVGMFNATAPGLAATRCDAMLVAWSPWGVQRHRQQHADG